MSGGLKQDWYFISVTHQPPTGLAGGPKSPTRWFKPDPRPPYIPHALSSLQLRISCKPVSKSPQRPRKRRRRRKRKSVTVLMATNGEGKQNEAGRHQEVGHKSLLQSDALYQVYIYILAYCHQHFESGGERILLWENTLSRHLKLSCVELRLLFVVPKCFSSFLCLVL